MRIVGIELDLDAMSIKFSLWGNNTDWDGWSLTGGAFPADAGEPGGSWGDEDPPPDVVTETNVTLGINEQMGAFTGLIYGGPVVIPVPADSASNNAAMGEFTGVIRGEIAGDADWASVVLLLHCNGTDGSTTITDSSSFARTGTCNANLKLSTTRSKFGSASLKVTQRDTGGIVFGPSTDFAVGTGEPYTMECWVYVVTTVNYTSTPNIINWNRASTFRDAVNVYGLTPAVQGDTEAFGDQMSPSAITANAWHHLAYVFDGTNVNLYVDGTSVANWARSNTGQSTGTFYIGGLSADIPNAIEVYIDEVRVTIGAARYTATFTPPSSEFPEG